MRAYDYPNDGVAPLDIRDIHVGFNFYRVRKYLLQMLLALEKRDLWHYRILEAGCAGGEQLRFLTENRAKPANCFGFDISERAVRLARGLSPAAMHIVRASVLDIPWRDGVFDVVLCFSLFDCFLERDQHVRISRELRRIMRGDGVLLVLELSEVFPLVYPAETVATHHSFDTRVGELEGLLSGEFTRRARKAVFGSELYTQLSQDGSGREPVLPPNLPQLELQMEMGRIPMSYHLYAFTPNP